MFDKLQNFISKFILICVALLMSIVLIQMGIFYSTFHIAEEPVLSVLVLICAIALVILVGYLLVRLKDDPKINRVILITMLIVFFLIGLFWLKFTPNEQLSDFATFWGKSQDALQGRAIYKTDNDYFAKWAYQTGYLVYVMGIIKLFGAHVLVLQVLNVLYQTLTLLVVYKLAMKIFDNVKIARLSVLLLMIDLDWFAMSPQNNNSYLGTLLFLVTFYLLMHDKYWHYILAGLTLALGNVIRPIGPVAIAGIVVFAVLYKFYDKKINFKNILKLAVTFIIYLMIFSAVGLAIKSSGLNEYGISNRDSEWKFVTGLDYNTNGIYDQNVVDSIDMTQSRKKVSKQEYKVIHEEINYLNDNNKWIPLFWNKLAIMWANRSSAIDFANIRQNHSEKVVGLVNLVSYMGTVLLVIFGWIGSLRLFKISYNKNIFLLLLPFMAYVAVQLLIEVQGRYRIEFTPVWAIIAGVGLYSVSSWINSKRRKDLSV